jgi:hypothetical protein
MPRILLLIFEIVALLAFVVTNIWLALQGSLDLLFMLLVFGGASVFGLKFIRSKFVKK